MRFRGSRRAPAWWRRMTGPVLGSVTGSVGAGTRPTATDGDPRSAAPGIEEPVEPWVRVLRLGFVAMAGRSTAAEGLWGRDQPCGLWRSWVLRSSWRLRRTDPARGHPQSITQSTVGRGPSARRPRHWRGDRPGPSGLPRKSLCRPVSNPVGPEPVPDAPSLTSWRDRG